MILTIIPLHKIKNVKFRAFLQEYTQEKFSKEAILIKIKKLLL